MDVIESKINVSGKEFKDNFAHFEKLVKDLKDKINSMGLFKL